MNDWTTDNLTNNKRLFNCDKRQAPMTLWFFIANNITVYRQSRPITSYLSWPINQLNQSNRVKNQSLIPSTAWHNSLWLWRWLPHRLSKRQSLSTTTVLFRTTFTQMIKLNPLLKWLLGSNPFTNLKQFSVLYLGPKIWNSLPVSIRIYLKLYHKFLILNYL